jgi:hypothetical protein
MLEAQRLQHTGKIARASLRCSLNAKAAPDGYRYLESRQLKRKGAIGRRSMAQQALLRRSLQGVGGPVRRSLGVGGSTDFTEARKESKGAQSVSAK